MDLRRRTADAIEQTSRRAVRYTEQCDTSIVAMEELSQLRCPFSLHEIDVDPFGITAEAAEFGYRSPQSTTASLLTRHDGTDGSKGLHAPCRTNVLCRIDSETG
jgi:hypothetical protein